MTVKSILKYMVFIGIAGVLLYLAFRNIDTDLVWKDLQKANYSFVVLGSLCGYLAIFSRGLRWNILLETLKYYPKKSNSINSVSVGYFANLAVPRMGEITRCTALNKVEKIPVEKLFGTVILERVIDMVMLLLCFCLAFLLKFQDLSAFITNGLAAKKGEPFNYIPILVVVFILVLQASLIFLFRKKLVELAFIKKITAFLAGLAEGFKTILKLKQKRAFFFHTLFIWVCYFLMSYLYFFCLPETAHLTVADGVFMMIVGSLGMIAPAPGGIGAFHAAAIAGLLTLNVSNEAAASYAVIVHTSQTLMIIVAGVFALILLSLAGKKQGDGATQNL